MVYKGEDLFGFIQIYLIHCAILIMFCREKKKRQTLFILFSVIISKFKIL